MFKYLLLILSLVIGQTATGNAAPVRQLDLPNSPKTMAFTYLYCLTDDRAALSDLLGQRLRYIGETEKNVALIAEGMISQNYCGSFMRSIDEAAPKLRQRVVRKLVKGGFTLERPITEQVANAGTESKSVAGRIAKGVATFFGKLFGGGKNDDAGGKDDGGEGGDGNGEGGKDGGTGGSVSINYSKHCVKTKTTSSDGTVTKTKVCESFTNIDVTVQTGSNPWDPTGYNPFPNQ